MHALAGDQHLRARLHRGGAGDRAGHQVPRRRLDHDPGDGRLLRDHAGDPPPLRQRVERSSPPTRRTRSCRPGCTRSCWSPSCTSRRCGRWPSPRRPGPTCSRASTSRPTPRPTNRLLEEWDERNIDVPLKVLHSPYREVIRPIVEYASEIRRANPRGVVAVYIPEYVVGRWWEQLLHNQTALRLKGRLLFTPGVMVISVPYQLRSSEIARERASAARTSACTPATCAAATRRSGRATTSARSATGEAGHPAPAQPRGRSRVGERFDVEVGPVAHGGHCVARLPEPESPGRLRPARAARRAGRRRDHRGHRRRPVLARRRRRGARRLAGPGRRRRARTPARGVRRLRLPARRAARRSASSRPPSCASSWCAWPARRRRPLVTGREVEAVPGGRRRACAGAPAALRRPARRPARRCASTAPTTSSRSTTACSPRRRAIATAARAVHGRRGVRGRRRRLLAGPPRAPRGAGRDGARRCWRRSRGSRRSTSTPASACSRAFLADAVGPAPRVVAVEGDRDRVPARPRSTSPAARGAVVECGPVDRVLRVGLRRALRPRRPRPAARGRAARRRRAGRRPRARARWRTSPATRPPSPATSRSSPSTATGCTALRAFDLFPMTHHVECVALLEPRALTRVIPLRRTPHAATHGPRRRRPPGACSSR